MTDGADPPWVPDSIDGTIYETRVRTAARGDDSNPEGHVVFRVYDATLVEAVVPDNMFGGHARQLFEHTAKDADPIEVRCSCGKWFPDRGTAHEHLRSVQGDVEV